MDGKPRRTDVLEVTEVEHPTFLPHRQAVLYGLVTLVFVLWGIANSLNHVLILQFMKLFELSRIEAGNIQSAYYLGYALPAIPAALFMRRSGYKATLILGLLLFASRSARRAFGRPRSQVSSYGSSLLCSSWRSASPFWKRRPAPLSSKWEIPPRRRGE
jgi:MFS family permease